MNVDFLLVGQGLAGSLLAWELSKRDYHVMVIDSGEQNASQVSAGIVNPITGMRLVKTEHVDNLLTTARKYYAELSSYFGHSFYLEKPMLRIFNNATEVDQARKRLEQADYATYLDKLDLVSRHQDGFVTPHGSLQQKQCGHLLTVNLLGTLKQWLLSQNKLRLTTLDYNTIDLGSASAHWQDISARQVIFCEGHHGSQNPWFSHLPFKPAKGEILTLTMPSPLPDQIFNYGHWLLPLSAIQARLGATFDWDYPDHLPTAHASAQLLNKLKNIAPIFSSADIVNHHAGIRPCTANRQPIIGRHADHPQLAIFNGFGAKGSLLIPWHAQRFADFLVNPTPLPETCAYPYY